MLMDCCIVIDEQKMDKTLCSTLLLLVTFVLLLTSSNESRKHPDNAIKFRIGNALDEKRKQDVLDIFKTVYNIHSNDTYISNIVNNKLWLSHEMIYGEIEMGQTTCTKIKSHLDKCRFKAEFLRREDILGTVRYVMLNPGENTCNKFLSEVANCPFNEQEVQQKKVKFTVPKFNVQLFKIVLQCTSPEF
ncbi:cystatin-related protein 1 [Cricetulus griseus]|uniref:Cystatin-related protein 1 n=1 Tax=Cricetulus griseus TaxID=10029 RepID=A0A061I1P6_CRIGR|nr:cystatin-related protein 1 [Cricetulus griseus]